MPEWVLGVLDPSLEAALAEHVDGCAECARVLEGYEAVVRRLPGALAPESSLALGPALEARLLARTARPQRRGVPRRLLAAAAACLVVLAALGAGYELGRTSAPSAEAGPRLAGSPQEQAIALEVIDSSRTTSRVLRSTDASPAYGKLWTRSDMRDVVAMVNKLPVPPSGLEYELWCESAARPGQMRMVGALQLDPDGFGMLVYQEEQAGPVYQVIEVALQPHGAPLDQGRIVLSWQGTA